MLAPLAAAQDAYLVVLGAAQDGGYPQAGCHTSDCMDAWRDRGDRHLPTALGLVDEANNLKYLFEATPAMPQQLADLARRAPDEEYAFSGVFLTHAHMGHYTGLMHFGREAMGARNVPVYAMPRMIDFLSSNGPWDQLVALNNIALRPLANAQVVELPGGIRVTPFLVPHRDEYSETVGYRIDGPSKSAIFIPDIDKWSDWPAELRAVVLSVDYALVDATFYTDGELPNRDMSEIRHPFVTETMALLDDLSRSDKARVIFIHMNNSNPLLNDNRRQYREVRLQGYRIAREGMKLDL